MVLDPFSTGVVTSLIANGLTALVSYGVKQAKIAKCRNSIQEGLEADTVLVTSIRDVAAKIGDTPLFRSNELQATMMQLFLESPTAESIVRQIYSDSLPEGTRHKSIEQLQKEFRFSLAYHLGVETHDVEQFSTDLFEVISMGCRKGFDLAINQGMLSAHEAKSIGRHRILLDELEAIKRNLEFFTTKPSLNLTAIKDFEKEYRRQIGERSRHIIIPHFDRAPRIDINRIFVSPNFVSIPRKKGEEPEKLSLDEFLTRLYRSVLLGDPGGGKSTLAQKICYELCANYENRLIGGRLLTPVLVVLREYSAKKNKDGSSIIQFMESEVTSKYQLPRKAPSYGLEYLLYNGHILVIFDGLDELLDPSHRREISRDVESFCNLFPSVPVLVTSRVVGYEQAPLDPDRFETFHIASFDDEQVSEYAQKWFGNDPDFSLNERERRTEAFLRESQIVSDLRSNPLMLALMCNLYRGAGFIPRNRPEVYKKCSEMLFERWDPSRGIWVHLPIAEPKVLLSHLAHWVYCDESLQSGVTENDLTKESTLFLFPRRFEIEEEAKKASREFIEFCRGRAWVFTDAGTTLEGIPLYKFTHKTFLEYFTAAHIVRNNNTPEKLWALLSPKIAERAWDVVAQLSFQMLHEQVEGASDELLNFLLQDAPKKRAIRWPYLSFGARCLRCIYPSPQTIRSLTEASVRCLMEGFPPSRRKRDLSLGIRNGKAQELIGALLTAAPECRPPIADSLQSEIINYAKNVSDEVALRAIDLGLTLTFPIHRFVHENPLERELYGYWSAVEEKIYEHVEGRLESLSHNNFLAFMLKFFKWDSPVEQLFALYTPDHLFQQERHVVFDNLFTWSVADAILMTLPGFDVPVNQENAQGLSRAVKCASEIGKILLNKPLPCFSYKVLQKRFEGGPHWDVYLRRSIEEGIKKAKDSRVTVSISGDAIIGAWCLWAIIAEVIKEHKELISRMKKIQSPVFKAISSVIKARVNRTTSDEAVRSIEGFNPSRAALEFVDGWITGQVSFVRPPARKSVKK